MLTQAQVERLKLMQQSMIGVTKSEVAASLNLSIGSLSSFISKARASGAVVVWNSEDMKLVSVTIPDTATTTTEIAAPTSTAPAQTATTSEPVELTIQHVTQPNLSLKFKGSTIGDLRAFFANQFAGMTAGNLSITYQNASMNNLPNEQRLNASDVVKYQITGKTVGGGKF